jgi:hypothetical protein
LRDIPIPGSLEEPIGSQLVTVGLETSSLIQSGRPQIMLDQTQETRAPGIVLQQIEQTPHRAWLTPVHELESSTMGILGPENGMVAQHPPSPGRIVKLTAVRDPCELDLDPPTDHRRDPFDGPIDQPMGCISPSASTPPFFVEDEDRRLGDGPRRDVELAFFRELAPDSRAIVQGIEPTDQGFAPFSWHRVNRPPRAADVVH